MKKPIAFVFFLTITIISLSVLQVVVSNRLSTSGILLDKLEKEIDTYEKENYALKEELYTLASLTQIASSAGSFGFVGKRHEVVLMGQPPIALKR